MTRHKLIERGLMGPHGKFYNLFKSKGEWNTNLFLLRKSGDTDGGEWFQTQADAHAWLGRTEE